MIAQLRQSLRKLQRPAGIVDGPPALPLGVPAIDLALGGGLMRGALHEIAAAGEAHAGAAAGFAIGVSALGTAAPAPSPRARGEGAFRQTEHSVRPPHPTSLRSVDLSPRAGRGTLVWIAEDMALTESGAPYGPGLDNFGLSPERLLTVAAARTRDLLWAMEEALHCRATAAVIGELRHGELDAVAVRRLSLAAAKSGALALLLRASPPRDASTAATRWIVSAAPSLSSPSPGWGGSPSSEAARRGGVTYGRSSPPPGALTRADLPPPGGGERESCFAVQLTRNRRGPLGVWTLQWSDDDERFVLATPAQPVAAPAADRPHRQVA
jgi:protein ImuA